MIILLDCQASWCNSIQVSFLRKEALKTPKDLKFFFTTTNWEQTCGNNSTSSRITLAWHTVTIMFDGYQPVIHPIKNIPTHLVQQNATVIKSHTYIYTHSHTVLDCTLLSPKQQTAYHNRNLVSVFVWDRKPVTTAGSTLWQNTLGSFSQQRHIYKLPMCYCVSKQFWTRPQYINPAQSQSIILLS